MRWEGKSIVSRRAPKEEPYIYSRRGRTSNWGAFMVEYWEKMQGKEKNAGRKKGR